MKLLVLGKGKTGAIVAEIVQERGHEIVALDSKENAGASALGVENLGKLGIDVVIDFTTPTAVMENIHACARAKINIVVGTTGWYNEINSVRAVIEEAGNGLVFGSNFSIGVSV